MSQPLPYPDLTRYIGGAQLAAALGAFCIAAAMQPGTGGLATADYYKARGSQGYPLVPCHVADESHSSEVVASVVERTPAEDLAHVRAFLRPTMTDLSDALGVSRQALYDWQMGKPIIRENAVRLANLGRAADVLAAAGLTASGQLIRRPVTAGQSLLDIVRSGGSVEEAAGILARIVRRELQQKEALTARLAGRRRPHIVSDDDLGAPMLSEAG